MRKSSKIIMMAVAILLSLVLITTSIVSGTLAKFVVEKSATVPITLKKQGITLNVYNESSLVKVTDSEHKTGFSVSATYNLSMNPDMNVSNALRFVFSDNQAEVASTLTVSVDVELSEKLVIAASNFSSSVLAADTVFMPIEFKVCSTNVDVGSNGTESVLTSWSSKLVSEYDDNAAAAVEALESYLEEEIAKLIKIEMGSGTVSGNTVTRNVGTSTFTFQNSKKGIGFGFNWPKSTDTNRSYLETWLVEQFGADDVPISVTYTVTIQQN